MLHQTRFAGACHAVNISGHIFLICHLHQLPRLDRFDIAVTIPCFFRLFHSFSSLVCYDNLRCSLSCSRSTHFQDCLRRLSPRLISRAHITHSSSAFAALTVASSSGLTFSFRTAKHASNRSLSRQRSIPSPKQPAKAITFL